MSRRLGAKEVLTGHPSPRPFPSPPRSHTTPTHAPRPRSAAKPSLFSPSSRAPQPRGRQSLAALPAGLLDDDEDEEEEDTGPLEGFPPAKPAAAAAAGSAASAKGAGGRRRVTASPGQIAFFSSLLNASGNSENGGGAENAAPTGATTKSAVVVVAPPSASMSRVGPAPPLPAAAAAAASPFDLPSSSLLAPGSAGRAGDLSFPLGVGRAAAHNDRRQSLLSPGMAALFGDAGGADGDDGATKAIPSSMRMLLEQEQGEEAPAAPHPAPAAAFGEDKENAPAAAAAAPTSARRGVGPGHRMKTPGRSCLTAAKGGKGGAPDEDGAGLEGGHGGTTGRRTGGRRTVIFGSPQAAEYQTDAAPAESIRAMEKSAAKARFRLGGEPELPFPSLDAPPPVAAAAAATASVSFAATAGDLSADEDGASSVESLETSRNTAALAEWEEDAAVLESSVVRNKRAREAARAKARASFRTSGSAASDKHDDDDEDVDGEAETPEAPRGAASASASAPSPSAASSSKRSRRSSTGQRRTASMDSAAAEADMDMTAIVTRDGAEEDEEEDDEAPASSSSAPLVRVPAPPTPLRRSRRVSGSDNGRSGSVSGSETDDAASVAALAPDSLPAGAARRRSSGGAAAAAAAVTPASAAPSAVPSSTAGASGGAMSMASLASQRRSPRVVATAASSVTRMAPLPEPSPIAGAPPTSLGASIVNPVATMAESSSEARALAGVAAVRVAPVVTSFSPEPVRGGRGGGGGGAGGAGGAAARAGGNRRITLAVMPGLGLAPPKQARGKASAPVTAAPVPVMDDDREEEEDEEGDNGRTTMSSSSGGDASVASMDRTADTAQREALFAFLDDTSSSIVAAAMDAPAAATTKAGKGAKKGKTAASTATATAPSPGPARLPATSPGDLTAMLGAPGGGASFPGARGVLAAGGFGLQALLNSSTGAAAAAAAADHTTQLPASLGAMLADEGGAVGLARGRSKAAAAAAAPSASSSHRVSGVYIPSNVSFDIGAGLGSAVPGDGDHTYASMDAVAGGNDGDASVARGSPEASFTRDSFSGARGRAHLGANGSVYEDGAGASSMDLDATAASDDSAHSRDSVSTADVVEREARVLEGAGLTPNRAALLASARGPAGAAVATAAAMTAATTPAATAAAVLPVVTAGPNGQVTASMMASMATALAALQAPAARTPDVISMPIAGASMGTPGRLLGFGRTGATPRSSSSSSSAAKPRSASAAARLASPAVAAAAAAAAPAPFGFEEFCAAAGLRFFTGAEGLSQSFLASGQDDDGAASSSSSSSSSTRRASLIVPSTASAGGGRGGKDSRRRSSIALMARKSMAGRGGGGGLGAAGAALGPQAEEALASSLVTQFVLHPERAQVLNAAEILRQQVVQAAPVLSAYTRELDADPPAAQAEIARAHAVVAAFDLEGDACGHGPATVAAAEGTLSKLRDVRTVHELNARVVYLQWRGEMAKQRLESLSAAQSALAAQAQELQATDAQLAALLKASTDAKAALVARRSEHEGLAGVAETLATTCAAAGEASAALAGLGAVVGPLEAEAASLASRKTALLARIADERAAIAALDAEAAQAQAGGDGGGAAAGDEAAAESLVAAGREAQARYEALCARSGWRVAGLVAPSGSGASHGSVTLAYAHRHDGSSHVLTLRVSAPSSLSSSSSSGAAEFASLVHVPAGAASSGAAVRAWASSGIAQYYAAAVREAVARFEAGVAAAEGGANVTRAGGPLARLTADLGAAGALCAEVAALQAWYPCRFALQGGGVAWRLTVDVISSPAAAAGAGGAGPAPKVRLAWDLMGRRDDGDEGAAQQGSAVEAHPAAAAGPCSVIWIAGPRALSAAVSRAVGESRAAWEAAAKGAPAGAGSGVVAAAVKAAEAVLRG